MPQWPRQVDGCSKPCVLIGQTHVFSTRFTCKTLVFNSAPGRIRTCDRRIRSPRSYVLARTDVSGDFCDLQDFRSPRAFVSSGAYRRVPARLQYSCSTPGGCQERRRRQSDVLEARGRAHWRRPFTVSVSLVATRSGGPGCCRPESDLPRARTCRRRQGCGTCPSRYPAPRRPSRGFGSRPARCR
jgi:hypothetical protein